MATLFPHQHQSRGKPIHFFKIITDHTLHEGKLMIPNKFVEKYGESLSTNTIFLNTPNGAEWEMNLEKHGGKVWFQKGWKEFAKHHSLSHGHFLVFRCQSISHFPVHIFGLSALEIDYPSKPVEGKTVSNNQRNKPLNDESLEHQRPGQKRKDNSSLKFLQPYQMRSRKCVKFDTSLDLPKEALHHTDTKCKEKSKATANQVSALDRASSFQSCNPFFLLVMRPTYVGSRGLLNLPSKFCSKHFDSNENKRLINLQVLNGKVWSAKYLVQRCARATKFRLTSGWKTFLKDNNLNVDDVCVFELINRANLTFLVRIFRDTDNSKFSTYQESGQMREACQGQRKEMKTITATK